MRLSEKINGLETTKFLNTLKESENTKIEVEEKDLSADLFGDIADERIKNRILRLDMQIKDLKQYIEEESHEEIPTRTMLQGTIEYLIPSLNIKGGAKGLVDWARENMGWSQDLIDLFEKEAATYSAKYESVKESEEDSTKGEEARKTVEDQLEKNWEKKTKVGIEESIQLHSTADKEDGTNRMETYYRDDEGNLYCEVIGLLYTCTPQGELIAQVENQEDYELLDEESLNETTNHQLRYWKEDLYKRERKALKDLGDANWENLVGLKDRLPEEQYNAFMIEEGKIRAVEMIHSILTYAEPHNHTLEYVLNNRYMQKYVDQLGQEEVTNLINNEIEEYKNAVINKDQYTDSEGVTYNSVTFKDDKVDYDTYKNNVDVINV